MLNSIGDRSRQTLLYQQHQRQRSSYETEVVSSNVGDDDNHDKANVESPFTGKGVREKLVDLERFAVGCGGGGGDSTKRKINKNQEELRRRIINKHYGRQQQSSEDEDEDEDENVENNNNKQNGSFRQILRKKFKSCATRSMQVSCLIITFSIIIYFWPMERPEIETKQAPERPRPEFVGKLELNDNLDQAELLFAGQFNAPESMAWTKNKRSFYTGVEGGFILLVEPYEERWSVAAHLNGRNSVLDQTEGGKTKFASSSSSSIHSLQDNDNFNKQSQDYFQKPTYVPFCTKDIELYGKRAEFEPKLVYISRCSRPLGIRLSPNESYLYVNDPLSGFYRIDLNNTNNNNTNRNRKKLQVKKLIDFSQYQELPYKSVQELDGLGEDRVLFGDDIAVNWGQGEQNSDVIYMTDCSRRVKVRQLFRLMMEYDDTGRLLTFDTHQKVIKTMPNLSPVKMPTSTSPLNRLISVGGEEEEEELVPKPKPKLEDEFDFRNLSFPNGVELSANKSALLISDLNNRRILMHHLRGPLAGQTNHMLWVAGHSDNIRRGLDQQNGEPTYWAACGCAVVPGPGELTEIFNHIPRITKLLLKFVYFFGHWIESLGKLIDWVSMQDFGFVIKYHWLTVDPICLHGLVFQFNEQGEILRALHTPHFGSYFKILSEAHEVPLLSDSQQQQQQQNNSSSSSGAQKSALYLGSVYNPYLGRIELAPLEL